MKNKLLGGRHDFFVFVFLCQKSSVPLFVFCGLLGRSTNTNWPSVFCTCARPDLRWTKQLWNANPKNNAEQQKKMTTLSIDPADAAPADATKPPNSDSDDDPPVKSAADRNFGDIDFTQYLLTTFGLCTARTMLLHPLYIVIT